ncbi:MAG: TM2 domain-containing protein [Gammaproteobacteria bacterium]|nr:TM2 domain-containing protein [Gammaproteobacteria bacterium]
MAEKPERDESASGQETAPLEAGRTLEKEDPQRSNPNVSNSLIVAYVLWILLFPLGAHRFYLGRWKSAVVILLLSLCFCSIILLFV